MYSLIPFFILFMAHPAIASSGEAPHMRISLLWHLINLAILVFILQRVLRKVVPEFLSTRREKGYSALVMKESEVKQRAEEIRRLEEDLRRVERSKEERLKEYLTGAHRDAREMIERGRNEAEYLFQTWEKEIRKQYMKGVEQIREKIVEETFGKLEKEIKGGIDNDMHGKILSRCLNLLEREG